MKKIIILFLSIFLLFSCNFNFGKNNNSKIEEKNNYTNLLKYGYIFKNNILIINDKFKIQEQDNIKKLLEKVNNLKVFETNNLDIFYTNNILQKLKVNNIKNLRLKCISKDNLSEYLGNIIKSYNIKNIMIDNILCGNNNNFLQNDVNNILKLDVDKIIFNVGGYYLENILKSSKVDNVLVGTCKKNGKNITIYDKCGINF